MIRQEAIDKAIHILNNATFVQGYEARAKVQVMTASVWVELAKILPETNNHIVDAECTCYGYGANVDCLLHS